MINNHYHCQCYHHELAPSFSSSSSSSSPCQHQHDHYVAFHCEVVEWVCQLFLLAWLVLETDELQQKIIFQNIVLYISFIYEILGWLWSVQYQRDFVILERTWPSSLSMKYLSLQFFMCSPEMDKLSIDSYLEIDSIQVDAFNEDQ